MNVPAIDATIAMVVCVTLIALPWAVITCVCAWAYIAYSQSLS